MKFKFLITLRLVTAVMALALTTAQAGDVAAVFFADKQISDDSIYDHVKRRLANDADVKGGALDIDVKQGVVTLRGTLDTDKQKSKAEKRTKKVSGVKKVVDEIKLSGK